MADSHTPLLLLQSLLSQPSVQTMNQMVRMMLLLLVLLVTLRQLRFVPSACLFLLESFVVSTLDFFVFFVWLSLLLLFSLSFKYVLCSSHYSHQSGAAEEDDEELEKPKFSAGLEDVVIRAVFADYPDRS